MLGYPVLLGPLLINGLALLIGVARYVFDLVVLVLVRVLLELFCEIDGLLLDLQFRDPSLELVDGHVAIESDN